LFKIEKGKIRRIEAVLQKCSYGMNSGWSIEMVFTGSAGVSPAGFGRYRQLPEAGEHSPLPWYCCL
jgi:hypothetical protein